MNVKYEKKPEMTFIGYHTEIRPDSGSKDSVLRFFVSDQTVCERKQMETCGGCPEMKSCEKVGAIIGNNPDARGRLENAGSV